MNLKELEDRIALRELIDKISIFGDKRDFENQVSLFSENAISETIAEGRTILTLNGRKEMALAFQNFLQEFEIVYHFTGQHIVKIDGDIATGESYCYITLLGYSDGKKIKTTIGATYQDDYIRADGQWLVSKRISNFRWQDKMNT